ncbi:MAG TPA: acetyl-CoA carboxylase biotin carboxyl carrier protein [Flavobacteriales bacterium]|jgi:acetyl-CoA carboxylase biotin carboxyl carrier protein|nr:acetyl-CoA carboxylase biotin carboxyl carrier protein [Flavobacteriales bacterium]
MEFEKIQSLIRLVSKADITEVELETEEMKLVIRSDKKGGSEETTSQVVHTAMPIQTQVPMATMHQQPVAQPMTTPQVDAPKETAQKSGEGDESKFITVKSPMIGTFYRASAPDRPPFVEVGDQIKTGSVLCIIEAMKLFNEIESEVSGKVIKVLIEDASPVEYNQPLFLVEP